MKTVTDEKLITTSTKRMVDGERLYGRMKGEVDYPEITVYDGQGPGGGAWMFSIRGFKWADVVLKGSTTELRFENKTRVTISGGIVDCVRG